MLVVKTVYPEKTLLVVVLAATSASVPNFMVSSMLFFLQEKNATEIKKENINNEYFFILKI